MLLIFAFSACDGGKKAIFVGEAEPEGFSLSYQKPQEFTFEITEENKGSVDFALELTYFPEQMQGWEEIPLYYILQSPEGEEDKRFKLAVREGDKWRGTELDNGHDWIFEETIQKGVEVKPGKYTFKLFGDSKKEGKSILGIVRVTFKVLGGK